MNPLVRTQTSPSIPAAPVVGAGATVVMMVWLSTWTGGGGSALVPLIQTLADAAPFAALWFAAAVGLGALPAAWLAGESRERLSIQMAMGVGLLLALDAALGALGWLQLRGGLGAWAVIVVGVALLAAQLVRACVRGRAAGTSRMSSTPAPSAGTAWILAASAPALAVLLVAACSAPGWLWATEFGGYDALSYHLQLPAEWLELGRIEPLRHNVYSFLPGYAEAAYYHLAVLRGDALDAATAAQMLHALVAIGAACIVWRLAARVVEGAPVAAAAFPVFLGVPWTTVTGSLAYGEMFVVLLFGGAMLLALETEGCRRRRGFAAGIIVGAACGAKLTAVGMVVLPVGVLVVVMCPPRRWLGFVSCAAAGCLFALTPWLLRNGLHAGNAVFPFATRLFGLAHWTPEQAEIWAAGHASAAAPGERLAAMWNEVLRFGLGPPPHGREAPWKPQWSALWAVAAAGLILRMCVPPRRRIMVAIAAMLAAQVAFWMSFTHLQSRFMLPAILPLSIAAAAGAVACAQKFLTRAGSTVTTAMLVLLTAAWCMQPLRVFRSEGGGAPAARIGFVRVFSGDALSDTQRSPAAARSPAVVLNHVLPIGSRVLLVGDAAPFYYTGDVTYATTWDRGPISRALSASMDPAAWVAALREGGFTHVLVNASMLERWEAAGWNDPFLTAQRVVGGLESQSTLVRTFDEGAVRLYVLESGNELRRLDPPR